jgi:adenylate cyclase
LIATWKRNFERAKQESEAALLLNPNDAQAIGASAMVELYSGNPLAAIPLLERSIRLDPAFAQQVLHVLGSS